MPIRKPDQVVEHRLSFGKKEWAALQPTIIAANTTLIATAIGIVGVGGGIGLASYATYKWLQNNAGAIKWIKEHDEWIGKGAKAFWDVTPMGSAVNIWNDLQQYR
jgi:hypothetical protein